MKIAKLRLRHPKKVNFPEFHNLSWESRSLAITKLILEYHPHLEVKRDLVTVGIGPRVKQTNMQLFVAQTNQYKSYKIMPTILKEGDLNHYFEILASARQSINETILIRQSPTHWFSAKINVENQTIKLLIMDPTGMAIGTHERYLKMVCDAMADHFPPSEYSYSIYTENTYRQNDGYTCSAFALEDLKALQKMDKFLPSKYNNIFDFCEKNTYQKATHNGMNFFLTLFPLKMMLAMQSRKLLTEIIPNRDKEEQEHPVNKKRQIPADVANQWFFDTNPWTNEKANARARTKLKKIVQKTTQFLQETPLEKINEALDEFSLEGLKKRLLKI